MIPGLGLKVKLRTKKFASGRTSKQVTKIDNKRISFEK